MNNTKKLFKPFLELEEKAYDLGNKTFNWFVSNVDDGHFYDILVGTELKYRVANTDPRSNESQYKWLTDEEMLLERFVFRAYVSGYQKI